MQEKIPKTTRFAIKYQPAPDNFQKKKYKAANFDPMTLPFSVSSPNGLRNSITNYVMPNKSSILVSTNSKTTKVNS